jgi:hypothetical protein
VKDSASWLYRSYRAASAPAAYASRMVLPPSLQGSLPAGSLAFTGRELSPLDRDEGFQITSSSSLPGLFLAQHPKPCTEPDVWVTNCQIRHLNFWLDSLSQTHAAYSCCHDVCSRSRRGKFDVKAKPGVEPECVVRQHFRGADRMGGCAMPPRPTMPVAAVPPSR